MKLVLLVILNLFLYCFSINAQPIRKTIAKEKLEKKNFTGDHPEEAMEHEIELTKDPVLGYVPKERLLAGMEISKQQRLKNKGNGSQLQSTSNWIELGPNNIGGRTRAIMFDPNDPSYKKVWAGGVDGGLWYTNDITSATPIWINVDDFWANLAISCIAYSPTNTQVFYVGTGEGFFNSDAVRGMGIWKTTDGGATWNQLPSTSNDPNSNFDFVQKIIIHPGTGAVFAATGSQFCNRGGLFRSLDNGNSWSLVLGTQGASCATSNGRAADVEIGSDGTVYASLGLRQVSSGTLPGGIYKSTDAGGSWSLITGNGFPTSGFQRIEIAVAPSDANRVYAMVQGSGNALLNIYTSANKGSTWTTCQLPLWRDQNCGSPSSDMTRSQSWYDLILAVDPTNANTVLAGGVDLMKSTNAGTSWTQISSWTGGCGYPFVHADQHAIEFQPGSSSNVVFGNDGGVYYSTNMSNGTPSYNNVNIGYNVTQFYSCAIHPAAGQGYFLAGAQDNGTQKFTNLGMNVTSPAFGGDGAFCFIDQTNSTYQIASYVYNNFYRSTDNWATVTQILSSATNGSVGRFINPADYDDANHILYSAYSTTQVSRVSGVTNPVPNAEVRITITGMANVPTHIRVSPYAAVGTTTLFVGTGDGSLFKVTNAQGIPVTTNITGIGAPWGTSASISCVEIGASENDLLVTFSNYGIISVFRSTNGGTTWTNSEGDLPDMPVRWAVYNPNDLNEVYLATELGVWSTTNITAGSPSWIANNNNLANVSVRMLQMRNSDKEMIAATHGRGLFTTRVFSPLPASPPVAAFTSDVTTLQCGGDVVFTDQSTLAFAWLWDFGDGTTSEFQNPIHNYTSPGIYNVKLTVTNTLGSNFVIHAITVDPPFSLSSSATPSSICFGASTQLNSSGSGSSSQSYIGSNISYAPVAGAGTAVSLSDDQVSSSKPIGFTFRFFGKNYTTFYISSNGLITFSPGMPASPVYGQIIPSSTDPDNFIALSWNDLNPENAGSTISYFTTGVSPSQRLIVNYNTSHYGGVGFPFIVQAILYEGTNVIEIHTTTISNASGFDPGATTTQGIENTSGSTGFAVPGRNSAIFSATNDAYRFTPYAPYSYTWLPGNLSGPTQTVSPVNSSVYTVQVSDGSTCISSTNTVNVTVNSNPTPVANSNSPVCPGSSLNLTSSGGTGYSWSGANSFTSTLQNPVLPNVSSVNGGLYTVTVTNASGCTATTTTNVIVSVVDDGNVCTIDNCNTSTGIVSHTPVNIDDSNACTTDGCNSVTGPTHTTNPIENDNNICTTDGCDSITGPTHTTNPIENDNNVCTTDGCDSVNGPTHTTNPIENDNNVCTTDGCNSVTGPTHTTNPIENDNNVCTTDGCDSVTGPTHTTNPIENDNNVCTTDGCNSITGPTHTPNPIENDNNTCTTDGCNSISGPTHTTNPIENDNNVCTTDGCDSVTGPTHTTNPIENDNNVCTTDGCDSVTGPTHTTNPIENDNNVCTTDGCDSLTGPTHTTNPIENDNNVCTTDGCDSVTGPTHTTNPIENDNNVCTTDGCDSVIGPTHTTNPIENDNNVCTTDGCDSVTGPTHTTNPIENDNNVCTTDGCDSVIGPTHTTNPIENDNNVCTTDGCDSVTGPTHTTNPIENDNNVCTTDGCNSSTGPTHTLNEIEDDGDACTEDGCNSVTGNFHNPVNTDDGIACTVDGCNSITGVFHTPVNCSVTLYSNVILEGYYIGGGFMKNCLFENNISTNPSDADLITLSAMNPTFPYALVDSKTDTLKTNGNVSVTFGPSVISNNLYYLKVSHRNALTTWSANPVILNTTTTYIFSDDANKALGSNQIATHLLGQGPDGFGYAIYSGDIADGNPPGNGVQDGSIDATDFIDLDPFIQNGDGGYIIADLNGDGSVDATDFLVIDPNIQQGVGSATP